MGKQLEVFDALQELIGQPVALERGNPPKAKQQIAAQYYGTKALRTARAAQRLVEAGDLYESWLLLRTLYNLVVDALWTLRTPGGAERFYDAAAAGLERHARTHEKRGDLAPDILSMVSANREHFDRVKSKFTTEKGKVKPEWAPGNIRNRAEGLARTDATLKSFGDLYEELYARLSDFEHSHPVLFTLYVEANGDQIRAKPKPTDLDTQKWIAQGLSILCVLVVVEAGKSLGISSEQIAAVSCRVRELRGG